MAERLLHRKEMAIGCEDDVVIFRREVRQRAEGLRFNAFATAAITTASSELGRNAWRHAGGGSAIVEEITDGERFGLRLTFRDSGPGIADLPRVLAGGYSTANSLGLGVAGSRRLVDDFRIDTEVGRGTTVTVLKWKRERG